MKIELPSVNLVTLIFSRYPPPIICCLGATAERGNTQNMLKPYSLASIININFLVTLIFDVQTPKPRPHKSPLSSENSLLRVVQLTPNHAVNLVWESNTLPNHVTLSNCNIYHYSSLVQSLSNINGAKPALYGINVQYFMLRFRRKIQLRIFENGHTKEVTVKSIV